MISNKFMLFQFMGTISDEQRYQLLSICGLKPKSIYNYDEDGGLIFINRYDVPGRLTKENIYDLLDNDLKKIWKEIM